MMMTISMASVAQEICDSHTWEFVSSVGHGSFKETFHIKFQTGMSYALKIYKNNGNSERIAREIASMQRCNHNNIVKLHKVDSIVIDEKKYLYIIEDYIDGGALSDHINPPWDIESTWKLGIPLIKAIAYLNDMKIVHRDIKPDNILLLPDKTPLLSDFGLVRNLDAYSLTQSWATIGPGTSLYSAPEQLNNKPNLIDWRTDQYLLGISLTICCYGKHPYCINDDDDSSIPRRVAAKSKPSPDFIDFANSSGLPVLVKMIEPWPVNRYRDTEDLLQDWLAQRGE